MSFFGRSRPVWQSKRRRPRVVPMRVQPDALQGTPLKHEVSAKGLMGTGVTL